MKLSKDTMDGALFSPFLLCVPLCLITYYIGFKDHLSKMDAGGLGPLQGIELNVYVLTTGFWPTQAPTKCNLPNEIIHCCEVFKKFYLSNHNGRRLTWQTNMGTAGMHTLFVLSMCSCCCWTLDLH